MAYRSDRVAVGPHRIALDRFGSRRDPVLLLHGIPGWRGSWRRAATILAASNEVLVPDLAGFGDSSLPRAVPHAAGQAEILLALLDELAVPAVHLVGFDFGGPVAVSFVKRAPERVLSLSLAATNVFTDTPVPIPLAAARLPLVGEALFHAMFSDVGLGLLWRSATGDRLAFPRERFDELRRYPQGLESARRLFLASLRDLRGLYGEVEATLPKIALPSLVLWGESDPFFPAAVGRRTAAAIAGARYVSFPGCGHFLPEERPAEFVEEWRSVFTG